MKKLEIDTLSKEFASLFKWIFVIYLKNLRWSQRVKGWADCGHVAKIWAIRGIWRGNALNLTLVWREYWFYAKNVADFVDICQYLWGFDAGFVEF